MLNNAFGLLGVCFSIGVVICAPTASKFNPPTHEALSFMKQYGYIQEDDGQSEALYSESGISRIIKNIQKFGAIEQTGVMDNATLRLMSSKRCGVKDIINTSTRQKRFALGSEGWNKRNITYFLSNWSPRLGEESVVKNIQRALDSWGGYGRLNFRRSYSPDADIIVAFARGYHGDMYPFDGPGSVLAHAFFPYEHNGGDTLGGDIHFDDDERWTDNEASPSGEGTDFYTVALHELGHSLGLGHSSEPASIMFPYYQGSEPGSKPQLGYDDILGMYQLYITRVLKDDGDNRQYPTTRRTTYSASTEYVTRRRTSWTTERHNPRPPPLSTTPPTTARWTTRRPTSPPTPATRSSTTTATRSTISYDGDAESVDEHKNHDDKHHIPKSSSPSLPDICDGHVDAVATLRDELFVFRDEFIWRFKEKGVLESGYPIKLSHMFPMLPSSIRKVDAAYQRADGKIVIFTGNVFWVYDGNNFIEGSPKPLTDYGLPNYLNSIDAVHIWKRNGKTYLFKNERFWRYNENTKTMDRGYPMHMERWRGVPQYLDAATTWKDGATYFFKGGLFWKIDNNWVRTTEESPMPSPQVWFGCDEHSNNIMKWFLKRDS